MGQGSDWYANRESGRERLADGSRLVRRLPSSISRLPTSGLRNGTGQDVAEEKRTASEDEAKSRIAIRTREIVDTSVLETSFSLGDREWDFPMVPGFFLSVARTVTRRAPQG